MQDIENSLTFCKLGALHPSIIKPKQLLLEIQRISRYYESELPYEPKLENLFEYEALLKVNCKIEVNKIIYLISIPINYNKNFELFYLYSLPTRHGSEFVTIIPDAKYFLKSSQEIKPLNAMCTHGKVYQCHDQFTFQSNSSCEEDILIKQTPHKCDFTKLSIKTSYVEMIPEINQYLTIFLKEETIKIKCPTYTDLKPLIGIFLIKSDNCEIYIKEQKLNFNDKTYGSPILFPKLKIAHLKPSVNDNIKLDLKTLKVKEIVLNPTVAESTILAYNPSIWTIILYFCLIIAIVTYFAIKHFKAQSNRPVPKPRHIMEPAEEIQLPGQATF